MKNIMDTLTPKPPFNPSRKNKAVDFGTPIAVNNNKATTRVVRSIYKPSKNI